MGTRLIILLLSPCIAAVIGALLFIAAPGDRGAARFLLTGSLVGLIYFFLNYWIARKKNHRST